jgi:hypothetical protein
LVLSVVIALVVWAVTRAARAPAGPPSATSARPAVHALLARWTAAGLLTTDEAAAIATFESSGEQSVPEAPAGEGAIRPPQVSRRIPVVAEALGYLGGVLAVTGLALVVARYWPDLRMAVRLVLSATGAGALLLAGQLVHPDRDVALERLRGFAWVASTACAALFAGVVAVDGLDAEAPKTIVLAASAAVLGESGLLWLWRGRQLPFQQLTLFAAASVFAGSAIAPAMGTGAVGIAVWLAGVGFVVVGIRRLAPSPLIGDLVGGLSMGIGALMTVAAWDEAVLPFVVATAAALLAVALVPGAAPDRSDQLCLGIIGAITGMQAAPGAIGYFAQDAGVTTGVVVWLAGIGLLYLGIRGLVRLPRLVETLGAIAVLSGAAVTAAQVEDVAPAFGILTAIGLVAAGMLPGQALLSLFGSAGLLINVLWAVAHFFPGEGRAPLLIMVAGAVILATAVLISRSERFRRDLRSMRDGRSGPRPTPPRAAPGPA